MKLLAQPCKANCSSQLLPAHEQGCQVNPSWRRHRKCSRGADFGELLLRESSDPAVGEGSRVFPAAAPGVVSPRRVPVSGGCSRGTPWCWQLEPGEG